MSLCKYNPSRYYNHSLQHIYMIFIWCTGSIILPNYSSLLSIHILSLYSIIVLSWFCSNCSQELASAKSHLLWKSWRLFLGNHHSIAPPLMTGQFFVKMTTLIIFLSGLLVILLIIIFMLFYIVLKVCAFTGFIHFLV